MNTGEKKAREASGSIITPIGSEIFINRLDKPEYLGH
jgi:hypothetical protein